MSRKDRVEGISAAVLLATVAPLLVSAGAGLAGAPGIANLFLGMAAVNAAVGLALPWAAWWWR